MDIDHFLDYRNQKFIQEFWLGMTPDWICPHCMKGKLHIDESMFTFQETNESLAERNHDAWEPEWIEYHFIGTLTCSACKDNTFFTGVGTVFDFQNPETGEHEPEDLFKPKYFLPALSLLEIPSKCPESVSKIIHESFSIAWSSFSGAGSLVRASTEELMKEIAPDIEGTLGNKINSYAERDQVSGELLKAIKWLGNTGAHKADLEEHDLASAYKILELVLKNLFCEKSKEVANIAKIINEAKGPVR